MSITYRDLKQKRYLDATESFLETSMGIRLLGHNRARCPFHDDSKDSFRVYVNGRDETRFRCFGECGGDWDVYDLIMLKEGCNFYEAQKRFSDFLGIRDFEFFQGKKGTLDIEEAPEKEPDQPIQEIDVSHLTDEHRQVLENAAGVYYHLLFSRRDKFEPVFRYLERRGVDEDIIKRFKIGYSPALEDDEFKGRALLRSVLGELMGGVKSYQLHFKTSLLRLLDDDKVPAYKYYRQHIDHSAGAFGVYSDYFIKRLTFPIYDINGRIEGMIGRRLDNRGIRWLKLTGEGTFIRPKTWLYGIDKSARGIREYQTAVIVEGIFDFFAFYNISENKDKPIVVSTFGTKIQPETIRLFHDLGVKHLIIAFDMDSAGQKGIQDAALQIKDMQISFLGSLKQDEDPADRLNGVLNQVSNFAIRHLQKGMEVKSPSGKPVMASFLVQRAEGKKVVSDEILLKPASVIQDIPVAPPSPKNMPTTLWYRKDSLIDLLSYDARNRAALDKKLAQILEVLSEPQKVTPPKEQRDKFFRLPSKFIEDEHHLKIGDALILHLRLAIEQQTRKRKIKETDDTIADWMKTSRRTILKYKGVLWDHALLTFKMHGTRQTLSVRYFPKGSRTVSVSHVE